MQSPDSNFDAAEDAELRAVPVPEGLVQRLRRAALADDEGLDEVIRDVPVPAGLLKRLRRSLLVTNEGLDAAIRAVPVPVGLLTRLHRVPKNRIRLARLTRWATAVSLLIAIGLSYVGMMVAFLSAACPPEIVARPELVTSWNVQFESPLEQPVDFLSGTISPGGRRPDEGTVAGLLTGGPEIRLVPFEKPGSAPLAEIMDLFSPERIASDGGGWREVPPYNWGEKTLLGHDPYDELPELKKVAGLTPRGIDPPLVPWFPWREYRWYGVYPFVVPAAHPRLSTGVVPLGVDASSYELTRRYLEDGELPDAKDVRTEEFLAAVDYGFPSPKGGALELSTACGPSPFGPEGTYLLQIGVQGRRFQAGTRRPAHLVLAVDVSASMRWGGRLEMIRRTVSGLPGCLRPEDRISLVAFSEEAEVLVEDIGGDDAEDLRAAAGLLSVRRSTNVAAGLRWAYLVARRGAAPKKASTRIVLLTDGQAELGRGATDPIEQRLADAAAGDVFLDVIDLGQEQQTDPQLARFAQSGGGSVHRATNAGQIRLALEEIITGRSQLIARNALLKVTFDPKTVLRYRLFGHEADSMAGLNPARPQADFYAGQSATALYEIQLKPGGSGGDRGAMVELTWQEAGGENGNRRKLTRKVHRNQFAYSFLEVPPSLQEAALVAETAEILRQSPFAPLPRNSRSLALARVLELAKQVDTQLYERPTFVEFLSLVEQAQRAKPYRRGAGS